MQGIKRLARIYLWACVAGGGLLLLWALPRVPWSRAGSLAPFLAAVAGISLFPVQVRHKHQFAMASALILAALVIWGGGVAVLLAAVHGLVVSLFPKRQALEKVAFNTGSQALAAGAAAAAHAVASAAVPAGPLFLTVCFLGAGVAYSASNTLLVAAVVALHAGLPLRQLLAANLWVWPFWGMLWAAAAAIYLIYRQIGLFGLAVFLLPIVLARYSFKLYVDKTREAEAYVGQIEQANRQLQEKIRQLSALHEGVVLLTAGLDPDEVRERIRHVAVHLLGLPDGFLLERTGAGLACTARWAEGQPLPGAPLAPALLRAAAAALQGVAGPAGDYTLLPLTAHGSVNAVLGVRIPAGQADMASVLEIFSAQVAAALANSTLFQQTRQMASTDSLTGLANQRYMREALDRLLAAAAAQGSRLSLITLDMDKFKGINDRHGHPAGDAALQHMAGVIARHAGPGAVAARNGGDEFTVILPGRGAEEARAVAAAILAELQDRSLAWGDGVRLQLAASAGVATYPDHAATAQALISRADQSAYISKHMGPNRVTVWGQFPGFEDQMGRLWHWSGRDGRPPAELAASVDTLRVITGMVDARDGLTFGHSVRVERYAAALAAAAGLAEPAVEWVRIGGLLHDLGKIGVPEAILAKRGPLSPEEWRLMARHPEIGADLMRRIGLPEALVSMVYFHHESFDGRGYPTGASGSEIPVGARIISICDAFEAMTSSRPYRAAIPVPQAVAELRRCAGRQFDPDLVEIFVRQVVPRLPELGLSSPLEETRASLAAG